MDRRLYLDKTVFDSLCSKKRWHTATTRCEKLGIGRTTIYRWYAGEAVDRHTAERVSTVLDVRLGALFCETVAARGRHD